MQSRQILQGPALVAGLMITAATATLLHAVPAEAASKRYTVTAEYCEGKTPAGDPNPCGALVYADATSNYYVTKVKVEARGTQDWDQNDACAGYSQEQGMDLRVTEYGVWVLPAPCSYKLTIDIGGGDKKSQHVFLTPGCELVLESKGTTLNDNKPKIKQVEWTDQATSQMAKKGITVDKSNVSDQYYHAAIGQAGIVHYCNKDDSADQNYN